MQQEDFQEIFPTMMRKLSQTLIASAIACALSAPASAMVTAVGTELITFDEDFFSGVPFYNFDSNDAGSETDVVFSTTDPLGFNGNGPGENQLFINEPGLEGTTALPVDLRVDFLQGAVGQIAFGFATVSEGSVTFTAYNQADVPIATTTVFGDYFDLDSGVGGQTPDFGDGPEAPVNVSEASFNVSAVSGFPENEVVLSLAGGTAVYGEFNFELGDGGRYIIDNFYFTPAGEDIISVVEGALPDDPILPGEIIIGDNGVPEFQFEFPVDENGLGGLFPIFIDPIVAIGYDYTSSINVASVQIPAALMNGDDTFRLILPGVGEFTLMAGVPFDITSVVAGGVNAFTIDGIDTTELLDPNDPMAFVTGLTFVSGGQAMATMTPITFDTDANNPGTPGVPVPGTLLLLGVGLAGLHRAMRAAL